jgi:hypothetical protein
MFGKTVSEYLGFQRVVLAVLAAVGFARLALSLAGLPDTTVPLLTWGVGSLVMLVAKRVAPRPAVAA